MFDYNKPDISFVYFEVLPNEAIELGFTKYNKWLCQSINNGDYFKLENVPAIYKWYFSNDSTKQAFYIGKATSLNTRIWQHYNQYDGHGKFLDVMFNLLDNFPPQYDLGNIIIDVWFVPKDKLDEIEALFILEGKPLCNMIASGNKCTHTSLLYSTLIASMISNVYKYQSIPNVPIALNHQQKHQTHNRTDS